MLWRFLIASDPVGAVISPVSGRMNTDGRFRSHISATESLRVCRPVRRNRRSMMNLLKVGAVAVVLGVCMAGSAFAVQGGHIGDGGGGGGGQYMGGRHSGHHEGAEVST